MFVRFTCCPWTAGGVDPTHHESVQALEAAQNPGLTAKEMTATQKRDPKQTHASEGAMIFCANHRGPQTNAR